MCVANVRITGIMQKSNEVARSMAQLMKVGQLQSISAQFSKELIKVKHESLIDDLPFFFLRWASWAK